MPVGPSHSGRSSGGGRSFGGSRGGSGSFGGGRRSHTIGPARFVFFGRTYVVSSGGMSAISLLLFGLFFVGVFCFLMGTGISTAKENISSYQSEIQIMESDAEYYNNLIMNANLNNPNDNYFLVDANFGDEVFEYYRSNPQEPGSYYSFKQNGVIWYFVVYSYEHDGDDYIGTTYTQFSMTQLQAKNGKINIAYTVENGNLFSINADYSLESNKDYAYAKLSLKDAEESLSSNTTGLVVTIVLIVGLVIGLVFAIKKNTKKQDEKHNLEIQKGKAEVEEAFAKADEAKRKAEQFGRKCEYCSGDVPDGETKCPNCGSSMFK